MYEFKQEMELKNKQKRVEIIINKIKEMAEYLRSEIKMLEDFTELDKNLSEKEIELKKKKLN